jgi:hypothetical protein
MTRSSWFVFFTNYEGDQIKEDEMGRACGMNVGRDMRTGF